MDSLYLLIQKATLADIYKAVVTVYLQDLFHVSDDSARGKGQDLVLPCVDSAT